MPEVHSIEVHELGPLGMIESIADALQDQGEAILIAADPDNQTELECAGRYARLMSHTASRLRQIVEGVEQATMAHLEGGCANH